MCEVARIAIFRAFSNRGIKNTGLRLLVTMNNFFSQRFVVAVRQNHPNAFVNAHGIEDLSAELIESWQARIVSKQFTPEAFEIELAQRIAKDSKIIDARAQALSQTEILNTIRCAKFQNGTTIGQFLHAWAQQQKFAEPKPATLGQDAVSLTEAAKGALDAAQAVNSAKTGVNDPDLCG